MTTVSFEDKKLTFTDDWVFHTVQGEGRFVGVPSVFVRLSACNLRCEWSNHDGTTTKCDTPYSSHQPEKNLKTIDETIQEILKYNCKHVVVTGGEPFLQVNVVLLINELVEKHKKFVTVETNGTIWRDCKAQFFSVSPKLATSCPHTSDNFEMHHTKRFNPTAFAEFAKRKHQFKFVANSKHDVMEIQELIKAVAVLNGGYDCENVYLMPQGTTIEQLDKRLPWIIETAKEHGWNVSDRFHIRAFGQKRGT